LADFIQPFAARDLNGDGYLDILGLSSDGLVIFFGRPGIHFAAPVHYAFYNVGGFDKDQGDPSLIADYDLDGNVDLAMPGSTASTSPMAARTAASTRCRSYVLDLPPATASLPTSMKTAPPTSLLRVPRDFN
jgi:hypothetical protein